MAHDILFGQTSRDWSTSEVPIGGSLPRDTPYAPKHFWTEAEAEADVQKNMKGGGLFGSKLSRKDAEESTIASMRANKIGITHPSSAGSLLMPDKQQKAFFAKIDDIRYDVRRAGAKIGGATLVLSAALGLLGVASLFKTFKAESREPPHPSYRWNKPRG